jgi:hypothetical protein
MTNHVLLDNISHKDLKINTNHDLMADDNLSYTLVFPSEFKRLQADYPIFFRKNTTTAEFEAVALFGFTEQENLFVNSSDWNASYIPLTIERRPFLIGFEERIENGVSSQNPVVHVDMDSPRVSQKQGESVFLEHGGNTPYLQHINSVLLEILNGGPSCKALADTLIEFELLEAFTLKIQLDNGELIQLGGFYTINEEKLANLAVEVLATLHQKGYLQHIYMMIASNNNIAKLITKKNFE